MQPAPSGATLASSASDVFGARFGSVQAGQTSACPTADELTEADGKPYQHVVGNFLLAHFESWGKYGSLTPEKNASDDPTGLQAAFANRELGSVIDNKIQSKTQGSIPTSPPSLTLNGIKNLVSATALLHHHGDFLHMAMEVDCNWRKGAEKQLLSRFGGPSLAARQLAVRKWLVRFLVYEAAYFNAYVRNGEFGAVTIDTNDLKAKLQTLSSSNPAFAALLPQLNTLIDEGQAAGGPTTFGKIGTAGFEDVFGNTYQIQAIQAQIGQGRRVITIGHIDYAAAEAGLIRVFLEAFFDASDRVPAVPTATGAPAGLMTELSDLGLPMNTAGADQFISAVALPVMSPTAIGGTVLGTSFTNDDISRIEKGANNAETVATAAIEAFPEGILGVTEAPALRVFLQTLVGVTARKAAEDIGWARLGYHPPS